MSTPDHRHSFSDEGVVAAVGVFESIRARRASEDAEELVALAGAKALVENAHGPVAKSSAADIAYRSLIADLAAATRVSERAVRRWVDDAADLVDRFGGAVVALSEGRISKAHVQAIYEHGTAIVDDDARDAFVSRMVGLAEEVTPSKLRQVARVVAERAQPRSIDERHQAARLRRRVRVFDLHDGMSELLVVLPTVLAHAIYDKATTHARSIVRDRTKPGTTDALDRTKPGTTDALYPLSLVGAGAGEGSATGKGAGGAEGDAHRVGDEPAGEESTAVDGRSMDELRADVVADLLLTGTASTCTTGDAVDAIHATVQITVPVLRMTGESEEPALLAGQGPIDAGTARRLAGGAKGWERVMTSPIDGAVLAVDRYRPSKRMLRFLRARDEHCRFPGCRQPVWRCDLDHTVDHAHGGPTTERNLAHLCRHHHTLKHASAWRVRQLAGGVLEWTSPTGRTYTDRPEPTVRFTPKLIPDGPPPPF